MGVKNICYFGTYSKEEIRNRLNIRMLAENFSVTEINSEIPPFSIKKIRFFFLQLMRASRQIGKQLKKTPHDAIFVGYPGVFAMFIAKRYSNKPIIFDPFISIYESTVFDYQTVRKNSLIGRFYFRIEKWAFQKANLIIADTEQHLLLFREIFHISTPIYILPIGNDLTPFRNQECLKNSAFVHQKGGNKTSSKKFIVQFIGSYIPLQGIEYIIKSAALLKEHEEKIQFQLIGGKPEQQKPFKKFIQENGIKNISFIDPVPFSNLPNLMSQSDVQLGIFGDTLKTSRVIPKKAILALSIGKPLISGDTEAMRSYFTHKTDIYLCPVAKPQSIADAIIFLYTHPHQLKLIRENGLEVFNRYFSEKVLTDILKEIVEKLES